MHLVKFNNQPLPERLKEYEGVSVLFFFFVCEDALGIFHHLNGNLSLFLSIFASETDSHWQ